MSNIELIKYFASIDKPLIFEINDIVFSSNHPQKENLNYYLENIDEYNINEILSNNDYKLFGKQMKPLSWRDNAKISYAKSHLDKEIGRFRLDFLLNDSINPTTPYDLTEFKDIEIDDNNLISISKMQEILKSSKRIFQILLTLPVPNSMYWCAAHLFALSKTCDVKVRLDPFLIFNKDGFSQMNYKMFIYGKPPDLNSYNSLKETTHVRWMDDQYDFSQTQFTDAVWIPKENEVHIIFEEIPKTHAYYYRASRYFHTIFNKETNKIEHFDGAIRIYNKYEIEKRINCHVKHVGKIGKRVKVFQIDSEVDVEKWSNVASSFFVWNDDVKNYFSN
ncbi:MAG: hypothetical protein H6613_07285 [Ignavibacteriales bacterium]|nr:hypothetical protein [Ignavibacteriales bacterium]